MPAITPITCKNYVLAINECFKTAAMYGDKTQTGHAAKLLELSLQPSAALDYFTRHKSVLCHGVDTMFVQDISDYLNKVAMQ